MDWGAVIIFIFSIIGAVNLAGGDIIVGIIAFLIIFSILAAILSIIKHILRGTKKSKSSASKNANIHIVISEESFALVHDQVMRFLQYYSEELPNEWYHYFISQEFEHVGNKTYGYLKFEIMLGSWSDYWLYNYPESKDYMKTIFDFNSDKNTFTYKIRTADCSSGSFPQNKITKIVHEYLDRYEKEHPGVCLKRQSWGAAYSKN